MQEVVGKRVSAGTARLLASAGTWAAEQPLSHGVAERLCDQPPHKAALQATGSVRRQEGAEQPWEQAEAGAARSASLEAGATEQPMQTASKAGHARRRRQSPRG